MGKGVNFRLFNTAHRQNFLTALLVAEIAALDCVEWHYTCLRMTLIAEVELGIVLGVLLLVAGAFLLEKIVEAAKSIAISPRDAGLILAAIGVALLVFAWVATHH